MSESTIPSSWTSEKFSVAVETQAQSNCCTLIEAVVDICESNDVCPSEIAPLISQSLKDKLHYEAASLNLLKCKNTTHEVTRFLQ